MPVPVVTVELDPDNDGTFPTDVSNRADLTAGITVNSYGRTDEFSTPQASTLGITLDNSDSALSVGSAFDTTGFDTAPYGGGLFQLNPGTGIRVTVTADATTRRRFTGKVESLDMSWPGGQGVLADMTVTASDNLAPLSRRVLRSVVDEEMIHLDAVTSGPDRRVLYTLGEAEGSVAAGDTSGNNGPPLTIAGSGAAPTFGTETGTPDSGTGVTFAGGRYLYAVASPGPAPVVYALGATFTTTHTPSGAGSTIAIAAGWSLTIDTAGRIQARGAFPLMTGPVVTDGLPHACMVMTPLYGGVAYLVLDGATVSASYTVAGMGYDSGFVSVGGAPSFGLVAPFVGTISRVFAGTFIDTNMNQAEAEYLTAAALGLAIESTADRFSRLVGYTGLPSTTDGSCLQEVAYQSTAGVSALDALNAVAAAEGGVVFAAGDGTITLQGRDYRAVQTTPVLSLAPDDPDAGTAVAWDTQQRINQVTVTRTNGATQLVGDGGVNPYPNDLQLIDATDNDVLQAANWLLAKHQDTSPRIATITVDLLTSPLAEQMLALDIGDRIALTGMPGQLWNGATDYTIEGWSETITDTSWQVTWNLLPWSLETSLILDDATYGALDSYPIRN